MLTTYSKVGLMSEGFVFKMLILAVSLCLWGQPAIAAESPQTVVQAGTDRIVKILKEYPQDNRARRERIQQVVDGYFDFPAISRLAVGPRWNSLSPEKKEEFTEEFSKLLFNTYIDDIEKYAMQPINYSTRSIDPGYVVVEAQVIDQGGPATLDYYLHLRNGGWRVYDVAVQGMSLAANYRDQFNTVLANSSFDDLSAILKQKIAKICRLDRC